MKTQVQLTFSKSTKGTHVYIAQLDTAAIQSLYVKRAALPTTPPEELLITIETVEGK